MVLSAQVKYAIRIYGCSCTVVPEPENEVLPEEASAVPAEVFPEPESLTPAEPFPRFVPKAQIPAAASRQSTDIVTIAHIFFIVVSLFCLGSLLIFAPFPVYLQAEISTVKFPVWEAKSSSPSESSFPRGTSPGERP